MKAKFKWLVLLALVVVLALALTLSVACDKNDNDEDGDGCNECEYLEFTLNRDGESYSVGLAQGADRELKEITIPSSYKDKPVTSIEENGFAELHSLEKVTIPDSVTTIGKYAFADCRALTSVNLPATLTELNEGVFKFCFSLTSVTIPSSVTTIGEYAFAATDLTSIVIPDSVKTIGAYAFWVCDKATSLSIGSGVETIGDLAFSNCSILESVIIPDNVTTVGAHLFLGCHALKTLTIGKGLRNVGNFAFITDNIETVYYNAIDAKFNGGDLFKSKTLTNVYFGDEVKSIPDNVFKDCVNLTQITLPEGLISIGSRAFENTGLTSLVIPDSVRTIDPYAFYSCELYTVTVGKSVEQIGTNAFHDNKIIEIYNRSQLDLKSLTSNYGEIARLAINIYTEEGASRLTTTEDGFVFYSDANCTYLVAYLGCESELTLPEFHSQYTILSEAFRNNSKLTKVTFSSNVIAVDTNAFVECVNLESVVFNEGLRSLNYWSFSKCSSLKEVNLPSTVTFVSGSAFKFCESIESITVADGNSVYSAVDNCLINGETLTLGCKNSVIPSSVRTIGSYAFYGCMGLKSIVIPEGVERIESYAFDYCINLEWVVVPTSVNTIGDRAFPLDLESGELLVKIFYTGTEEQWGQIVGRDGKPCPFENGIYFLSESEPAVDGNFWHWKDGEPVIW